MKASDEKESKTVTADSTENLQKLVDDMIENGWQTEGEPSNNEDQTYSQRMVK